MELDDRELLWDGCVNARDLGGLGQIKPGAVVRMEAPRRLTEAGWAAAWAYGVRTVVDLRDADEREPDCAPRPAGITTVHVPLDPVGTGWPDRGHPAPDSRQWAGRQLQHETAGRSLLH